MSFEALLQLIKTQDRVQAGVVNRPLRTIDQNTRYLWDILQAAAIGSTVYLHRQTVEAEANVGMAVWYNNDTQQFERGLGVTTTDPVTGALLTAPSAQIWGVVATKLNATLAEILLYGVDTIDIDAAVENGAAVPGLYYLSGTTPGMLVLQQPPVSVAILRVLPDGRVFVQPQFVDFLDRHTHYRFDLICAPAGDTSPPAPGAHHTIANADVTLPGWLPASDPSFEGLAPKDAVFGYNLAKHPSLKNTWPPLPASNAYLERNKGEDPNIGATGVPLGADGLCVLDRNGIWWMSSCYDQVPWPVGLDTTLPVSDSASQSDECPLHLFMEMTLWFTRLNFSTDVGAVASLRSIDPRILVQCLGTGAPASSGDLQILLNLEFVVAANAAGYQVLKTYNPDTNLFYQGPVVEAIYANSGNVILTGDLVTSRTINGLEKPTYQGLVGITVLPASSIELDVSLVRLDGADEEFLNDIMYLSFIPAEQRAYRAKIKVPDDLGMVSPQMRLRFRVMGSQSGTLPQLTFTARRVPRPVSGLVTPLLLPDDTAEFAVTCDTTGVLTAAYQYVEATSDAFAVAAGDTVYFTVQREAADDWAGEVGILDQAGVLTPA